MIETPPIYRRHGASIRERDVERSTITCLARSVRCNTRLNEAETLGTCIEKAQRALREHKIAGEIIVADNGSTDGSQAIAVRMGARVIRSKPKGYGNARWVA